MHRHQAQIAMDADDAVLPDHPLGRVVGDADDDLQVGRLDRPSRGCYDREGEHDKQQEVEKPAAG